MTRRPTVAAYCLCGASLRGSSWPPGDAQVLVDEWWRIHSGDGHGPVSRQEATNARRRLARWAANDREWQARR